MLLESITLLPLKWLSTYCHIEKVNCISKTLQQQNCCYCTAQTTYIHISLLVVIRWYTQTSWLYCPHRILQSKFSSCNIAGFTNVYQNNIQNRENRYMIFTSKQLCCPGLSCCLTRMIAAQKIHIFETTHVKVSSNTYVKEIHGQILYRYYLQL
jgi:hypothetical protein